jgi:hypothetical protein
MRKILSKVNWWRAGGLMAMFFSAMFVTVVARTAWVAVAADAPQATLQKQAIINAPYKSMLLFEDGDLWIMISGPGGTVKLVLTCFGCPANDTASWFALNRVVRVVPPDNSEYQALAKAFITTGRWK